MVWLLSVFTLVSAALVLVRATAVNVKRQTITPLTPPQIDAFTKYARFASAAYCDPSTIKMWNCGANCQVQPDFQPVATGGDGSFTQFWYVGYSISLKAIIVAYQGTDSNKLFAGLTGDDVLLEPLDPALFPGIPSDVKVHHGFAREQARSASAIRSAVQNTLSTHPYFSVTIVGHSLGGALALLDGLYLNLHYVTYSERVRVLSFGMPRIGNQAFANFVDRRLNVTHVNNREDPIPIMPDMLLGYHHSSGEVHIQDSGAWDACPGQDNPSKLCIVGDVSNFFEGKWSDHNGPYGGIIMGC